MKQLLTTANPDRVARPAIPGLVVALVEGVSIEGHPLLRWDGSDQEPQPAQAVWTGGARPDWADCKGTRAVVGFEDGDESRPIVLGLLEGSAAPSLKEHPEPAEETQSDERPKTLHIESNEELVLQCGKAKIALRADGRIAILGGYLLSRSTGVNKIKGGSVQIN